MMKNSISQFVSVVIILAVFLFSLLPLMMPSLFAAPDHLNFKKDAPLGVFVDGYVTSLPNVAPYPFSAHEPFTIYAVRGNDTIDVAHTDANGYYAFQSIPVWMLEHEKPSLKTKLFPNPYTNSTNIEMFAPKKVIIN